MKRLMVLAMMAATVCVAEDDNTDPCGGVNGLHIYSAPGYSLAGASACVGGCDVINKGVPLIARMEALLAKMEQTTVSTTTSTTTTLLLNTEYAIISDADIVLNESVFAWSDLTIGPVSICTTNGKVTIDKRFTVDEASKVFWLLVEQSYPDMFPGAADPTTQGDPR